MTHAVASTDQSVGNQHDPAYGAYLARLDRRFMANTEKGTAPLFTTDLGKDLLWDLYLGGFDDPDERQYHNCSACRHFIQRYGGLVTIDPQGLTASALWDEADAPENLKRSVAAMAQAVRKAKVTGVFLSKDAVWGQPETGAWQHLAVGPRMFVFRDSLLTAGQKMAEKREDFKTVSMALTEFKHEHVVTALQLLRSDALYRSEKVLGQAEWLDALHAARSAARNKTNVTWSFVAKAPAGFCHPRASMIGTLLEDIGGGMSYENVSERFASKMHPLAYQRPQAAPKAGSIAQAEKIVAELGAAGSLARRFARLEDIVALWRSVRAAETPSGSVFGHLKPKGEPENRMVVPAQTMTWVKFRETVLPTAERIQFSVPCHSGGFTALVTAVNPDAPPILQWDSSENRNPVSWYFWHYGANASQYGLKGGEWRDVEAVALKPCMWNGGFEHQGKGVMFVLVGARETRVTSACIFPETLRSEFHGVRSVIEAYSRGATIEGADEPHAAGIMLCDGGKRWDALVRVRSGGRFQEYRLDRWD